MTKPRLEIDLRTDGNAHMVIAKARQLVPSEQLDSFINATLDAQRPGTGKTYEDMLAIINQYVELVDTSGSYPAYSVELPPLLFDLSLSDPAKNIYKILGLARELLTPEQQERFDAELQPALHPSTRKSKQAILAIAAKYVHLQDTSGTNPAYPLAKEAGGA